MKESSQTPVVSVVIEDVKKLASRLGRAPSKTEYYENGKFKEWQVRKLFHGFNDLLKKAGFEPSALKIGQLEAEVKRLSSELSEAREDQMSSHFLRDLIGTADIDQLGKGADWLKGAKKPKSIPITGIPMLFLSDIHFDEVVQPDQIECVNEYNHEIAVKRIQHTFRRSIELLKHHMVNPKYDGAIVALGGDMLSGNIHEELAESNEQTILKSVLDLTDLLACGIGNMADEFGRVFVPGVVGNHGRLHKKPRAKFRVQNNFEWIIYQYLSLHFRNDPRVSFLIPESADAQFSVYDKHFLLTHGDQFKGGGGISGVFAPLMTGMARKQKRQQAVHRPFDVMMMGHWHQYIHTNSLLINGSIKGYDEYAYVSNFSFERPQQALLIVNPENDITFRMPILCDGYEHQKPKAKSKLVW